MLCSPRWRELLDRQSAVPQLLGSGQAQEPEPCVSNEIAADLADEEQQSITAQIANWLRQRYILEEQHAQLGLNTPPHVLTQIEDINQKVAELEKRLGELRVHG